MATNPRSPLPPGVQKQTHNPWTVAERDLLEQFFTKTWLPMTLYTKLHEINSTRTYESMTRELRRMRSSGHVRPRERALDSLRVGYLDIETSHLKANFGFIICWYIKHAGVEKYEHSCVTKKELFALKRDKRVLSELFDALDSFDVLYTHYGRRFDVPFIKTRALILGMEFRIHKPLEKYLFDTWEIARRQCAFNSNRLATLAETFKLETQKTRLVPTAWNDAMFGDKAALKYVDDHCKADVKVLELVHQKIAPVEYPKPYRSL